MWFTTKINYIQRNARNVIKIAMMKRLNNHWYIYTRLKLHLFYCARITKTKYKIVTWNMCDFMCVITTKINYVQRNARCVIKRAVMERLNNYWYINGKLHLHILFVRQNNGNKVMDCNLTCVWFCVRDYEKINYIQQNARSIIKRLMMKRLSNYWYIYGRLHLHFLLVR